MSYLMPNSQRCSCAACGLSFPSPKSFDAHRAGRADSRRCKDTGELHRATSSTPGLVEKEPGVWGFLNKQNEGIA